MSLAPALSTNHTQLVLELTRRETETLQQSDRSNDPWQKSLPVAKALRPHKIFLDLRRKDDRSKPKAADLSEYDAIEQPHLYQNLVENRGQAANP